MKWCVLIQKWVCIMLNSSWKAMQLCMKNGSGKHPNGPSTCTHALVLCYFGQMRWSWMFWNGEVKGNKFHVEHFSFGAWNMENLEVEVWKFQHVENFTKCQAIYFNIPPCLTFYVSSKWEKCLHKSCISFKDLQNSHQFHVIWIYNDRVMHFWSFKKSLVQWYRSKMT